MSAGTPSSRRLHLVCDCRYRVVKAFVDADGTLHPVGEEWTYIDRKFSRFEDEYIVSVRFASGLAGSFGLICEEDKQYAIVRHFDEYVTQA
jgi:hypothetical protein